jgi:Lrp/AsnC family leucine-responsive transcriptional regulator
MDSVDARILVILQQEGRISMRELGARVGLTGPAAAERVRRLEERGAVLGYRAVVSPTHLGRPLRAFISVALPTGCASREFEAFVQEAPEIQECHRITGEDCYLLQVALPDVSALQVLLERMSHYGRTRTSIVLSSLVESKPLAPLGHGPAHGATARPASQQRSRRAVAPARPRRTQPVQREPR